MSSRHIHLSTDKSRSKESLPKYDSKYGEYSGNWRNIIFLPFDHLWQRFIMYTVVLTEIVVIYDIAYDDRLHSEHVIDVIYYILSFCYLIDTFLSIAHRNMHSYRSIKEHEPKSIVRLVIDVVSLLPAYELYLLLRAASRDKVPQTFARDFLRMKCLLRIYVIYQYFSTVEYRSTANKVLIVFVGHYVAVILVTHFTGAIWNYLRCWKCEKVENWTKNLRYFVFNDDNPLNWLVICYTTIGNLMAHNWRGNIRDETIHETLVFLGIMMFGFIFHYMIFFGQLINAYVRNIRRRFLFMENLTTMKKVLIDIDIEKKWQDKADNYYSVYWKKRNGILDMPVAFQLLPIPLQKEVTVDIFWEALRHSHFFGKEDISFKRALSLEMKSEFFLPGDYVFKRNKIKSKMLCISTGILQILTAADEESPIISFSSGTILGEIGCLLPTKSIANVRCATYCELHTLSIDGLYRVLKVYPAKTKALQAVLNQRILKAKQVHEFYSTQKNKQVTDVLSNVEDSSIKWIKTRWREIAKLQRSTKKLEVFDVTADPMYTSEYLDLLVLSEKVELKMQVICLRGSCPFLMEPTSSFRRSANGLVIVAVIFQCLLLPYHIAFKRRINKNLFILCFFLDLIYILDIYMQLSTVIKKENVFISKSSMVLMERFKEISFLIDIIATLPTDYVGLHFQISSHLAALLKLNRLLKMQAVIQYFNSLDHSILDGGLNTRIIKYTFVFIITVYWLTCLMYSFVCFYEECYYYGWFNYNMVLEKRFGLEVLNANSSAVRTSLYYTLTTYISCAISNHFQFTTFDLCTHHILVILGYYITSFCFAEICAIFVLRLIKVRKYQEYLHRMVDFIKTNKISNELSNRMIYMAAFWWDHNENAELIGENGILNDATNELKDKTIKYRIKKCLAKVPLFDNCDEKMLNMVIQASILKTLPKDIAIVTANQRYTWIYVILRGFCKMKSVMAGDLERDIQVTLRAGDAFPVIEALHQVQSLITVTTTSAVEIICIQYSDLVEILLANPMVGKEISATLKEHFETYERPLLRKRGRLPEMIPEEHSLGRGDMFTYEIYDDDIIDPEEVAFLKPFKKLGKWYFIRYFFLRKSIDPHSTLFLCLEVSRCIFAVTRVFLGFTYFSLLAQYQKEMNLFLRFLDFTCVMDFYVRLHCQYYNEIGILVTHPWFTAKQYLRTSFMIDLFATLPFRQLQFDQLLGFNNRERTYTVLAVMSRPWQLHRVFGFLDYLRSDIQKQSNTLRMIKNTIFGVTLISVLIAVLQIFTCDIEMRDKGNVEVSCTNGSWIEYLPFKGELTPPVLYVKCFYVAVSIFLAATCGAFSAGTVSDAMLFGVLCIISFLIRWLIFAKVTSSRIGGNVKLTIYQECINSFKSFVRSECVDEDLVNETIEHFSYTSKKTQSAGIIKTLSRYHADLHEDIVCDLFESTLKEVAIFQGVDESFYGRLARHLQPWYYKKDSEIIRCNDVQGLLFFVYKGKVDITIAQQRMCTLCRGGIFGCLEKQGMTRQTITAVAKVHVQVLIINSNLLHNIAGKYMNITEQLKQRNILHHEFIEGYRQMFCSTSDTSQSKASSNVSIMRTFFQRIIRKMHIFINQTSYFYQMWNYIVCVHVASISSLCCMFYAVMTDNNVSLSPSVLAVIYVVDIIFIIKIYIGFHLTYVDHESGILIRDLGLIRRRYLKSLTFWMDIFTCFPFTIILRFTTAKPWIIKLGLVNRIFRFIYLRQYYNSCKQTLQVTTHLRWVYLSYWICINLQIMTSLWWLVACYDGQCYYLKSTDIKDSGIYKKAKPGLESIVLAYTYIVNLFTTTGLRDVAPLDVPQMLVSIFILIVFHFSAAVLSSEFATLLEVGQYTLSNYEYNIKKLRIYLEGRDLSYPIANKAWKYGLQLWQRQRGEWMPAILTDAPGYIKQDLMNALYGHHLHNHFLFINTHTDFLRQVIVHLKRCVFFPGNYLAEQGDIDGNMYFIHDGDVEVYEVHGKNKVLTVVLKRGDSFGEEHGLFNKPHKYSYLARTTVDALFLKRTDWEYLLEWFPASHEEILQKAAENGLTKK